MIFHPFHHQYRPIPKLLLTLVLMPFPQYELVDIYIVKMSMKAQVSLGWRSNLKAKRNIELFHLICHLQNFDNLALSNLQQCKLTALSDTKKGNVLNLGIDVTTCILVNVVYWNAL